MALCLGNSGDFAKAVASYKDSLQILKTATPVDNAEVARVANNLASFYALHWALGDAETYFLEAVKMRTDAYGRQSHQTISTLHDLGMFYLKCSQFEKSVTVFEEEVSNLRALGQNDLQVAESVSALARLYAHLGIFSYAEACLAEMKQIRCDCAADCTDREVFDSHLSTGIVLRAQGKLAESSMEFGLAVRCSPSSVRPQPGANVTHTLQVCKAAEYAHAQKLEKGDESMKHTTGDMCYTMLHYALALAQNGNFDQSECAFEKLTRTTEKTWGAHSFQLATVFIEQSKARLLEGKHHESQVMRA
jgi:tetratricopeptide (TPR) repeat protein